MPELKPCPFCGGKASFFTMCTIERGLTRGWTFGIFCEECDVTTPRTDYKLEVQLNDAGEIAAVLDERLIATETWNRRVNNG